MTRLLIDTSVLIKWFHSEGENELEAARAIRSAHVSGEVQAHMIDLAVYEVGNVLSRALHWDAADVVDQLEDLAVIMGPPIVLDPAMLRSAATLAGTHGLSFYDACWAAAARELAISLISADRLLLSAGLAETPTAVAERLRLLPRRT